MVSTPPNPGRKDNSYLAPITLGATDSTPRPALHSPPKQFRENTSTVIKKAEFVIGFPIVSNAGNMNEELVQQASSKFQAEHEHILQIEDLDRKPILIKPMGTSELEETRHQAYTMQRHKHSLNVFQEKKQIEGTKRLLNQYNCLLDRQIMIRLRIQKRLHPRIIIGRDTPVSEIITALTAHKCPDLTLEVNPASVSFQPVSSGGYGDVYKGSLRDQTQVAIKTLRVASDVHDDADCIPKRAARELYAWSKCNHRNVLPLLGLVLFDDQIRIISPWMKNEHLLHYLKHHPHVDRWDTCAQICNGLEYVHRVPMVHGDIKGQNILVSDNGVPMITDFGNAVLERTTIQFTSTTKISGCTPRWTAPEILSEKETARSMEADIYSLAMTVLEVLTGRIPYFNIRNEMTLIFLIGTGRLQPERPKDIPFNPHGNALWELLVGCWNLKPMKRPNALEVARRMTQIAQRSELPLIGLDRVSSQGTQLSHTVADRRHHFGYNESTYGRASSEDEVWVVFATGLLDGAQVMHKSYKSPNRTTAAQFAEKDLMSLTKRSHPHIACLAAIALNTCGYIRDIIVTAASMTLCAFLERVADPASVARFLKGLLELHTLINMNDWFYSTGDTAQMQVDYNGHVTAIPGGMFGRYDGIGKALNSNTLHCAMSPAVKDVLRIYYGQLLYAHGQSSQPELHRFIDRVSHLSLNFTSLDIFKVAADAALAPPLLVGHFVSKEPPSTTFSVGEFGTVSNLHFVKMLEQRPWNHKGRDDYNLNGDGPGRFSTDISLQADGWYCLPLCPDASFVMWTEDYTPDNYSTLRAKAKKLARSHNTALHELGQALKLCVSLGIRHSKNMCKHPRAEADALLSDDDKTYCNDLPCWSPISKRPYSLYFHRRPASRDCPREYWGFLSTSLDPYEHCAEFPSGTDRIQYRVWYLVCSMDRDYSVRCDEMQGFR